MEIKHEKIFIVITIVLIVLGVLYWYWAELIPRSMRPVTTLPGGGPAHEDMTAKQLQELEALRVQLPASTKTPDQQFKELDALRKQSGSKSLSEAEISKQLEELEKLRMSK